MSNFDPEGPTPKQAYEAPRPVGQDVAPDWNRIADAMASIAESNAHIRRLTEKMDEVLSARQHDINISNNVRRTKSIRNEYGDKVSSGDLVEEQIVGSQQELERQRSERAQHDYFIRRNAQKIQQEYRAYETLAPVHKINELTRRNIIDPNGKTNIGGQSYRPEAIQEALSTPQESRTDEQTNLVNVLNKAVAANITSAAVKQAPKSVERILDAVEDAGIRQLRYGQLTIQDILRSTGTLAGRYYERRTALPGIPGIGPEGEEAGGIGRLASLAGLVTRGAPVVGQALAIGQVVKNIGNQIYDRTYGQYINYNRSGQLTGEGATAGIKARLQGLALGGNPFDMISMGQGQEIVQGVRTQGFTGQQGWNVMRGVRDVVNNLGISIDLATQYFTDSLRKGGMSVDDVRKQMSDFAHNAHDLNVNINDYTQQILTDTQTLRAGGAGSAAPGLSQALLAALPTGYRTGEGQKYMAQIFDRAKGEIASRIGGGANVFNLGSRQYASRAYSNLDAVIGGEITRAQAALGPGADLNSIATYMNQVGVYTQGIPVDFLTNYISRQLGTQRGISAQVGIRTVRDNYVSALNAQRGRGTFRVRDLSSEQQQELGVTLRHLGHGEPTSYLLRGRSISGNALVTAENPVSKVPTNILEALRQRAISAIPGITKDELKKLESNITNPNFNVEAELNKIARTRGQPHIKNGVLQIPGYGITIGFKPGVEKKLFELTAERNRAINSGLLSPNQNDFPRFGLK